MKPRYLAAGAAVIIILMTTFALVLASPLAMLWFAKQSTDWERLSQVGQAYGPISAVLAALAFCGIAVSLILQWWQARTSQVIAGRE